MAETLFPFSLGELIEINSNDSGEGSGNRYECNYEVFMEAEVEIRAIEEITEMRKIRVKQGVNGNGYEDGSGNGNALGACSCIPESQSFN
ncbi:hypothetical protein HWI79_2627 [Cryptosporidium felis]|nr:hypothetical protein HWI79_2627 [Cryptosporidium felis]